MQVDFLPGLWPEKSLEEPLHDLTIGTPTLDVSEKVKPHRSDATC